MGNQYGNPTSVDEFLNIIGRLLQTESFGIYHAVCSGRTSRLAFTEQIIRKAGATVTIREVNNDKPTVFDTSLSTEKLQQAARYQPLHWRKALASKLDEVKHENCIEITKRCSKKLELSVMTILAAGFEKDTSRTGFGGWALVTLLCRTTSRRL